LANALIALATIAFEMGKEGSILVYMLVLVGLGVTALSVGIPLAVVSLCKGPKKLTGVLVLALSLTPLPLLWAATEVTEALGWASQPPAPAPLHVAVKDGDVTEVRRLIDEGAGVNGFCFSAVGTPLGIAARHGHLEVAQLLIDRGADVNAECPLREAAKLNRLEIAELLLHNGADPKAALYAAASAGHLQMIELFVENGLELGQDVEDHSMTIAAFEGHKDVVVYLLANGLDVNARGFEGRTALYSAAMCGHVEVVRVLLAAGADLTIPNYSGETPLAAAKLRDYADIVVLLEQAQGLVGRAPIFIGTRGT
jgi:hypothetical protein